MSYRRRNQNGKINAISFMDEIDSAIPPLHIRLCHKCLYMNEGLNDIGQCRRCGQHLTYDSFIENLSEEELADLWLDEELDEVKEMPKKSDLRVDSEILSSENEIPDNEELDNFIFGLSVIW